MTWPWDYFVSGEPRTHHVHMFQADHPEFWRLLFFRDYLRLHDDVAQAYERLKRELAAVHSTDPLAYNAGKTDFIREVDRKAAAFFGSAGWRRL